MSRQVKVVLACAGLFLSGALTGGFVVLKQHQEPVPANPEARPPSPPTDSFGPSQMRRFAEALELTDAQMEAIRPLITEAGEELRRLRRDSFRASTQVIERMESGVAEVLSEEQRVKLAEMQAAQRELMRQRMADRERRRSETGGDGPMRPGGPGGPGGPSGPRP